MKNRSSVRKYRIILIAAAAIIFAIAAAAIFRNARHRAVQKEAVAEGVSYLKSVGSVSADKVRSDIRAVEEQKRQEQKEEIIKTLSADPDSVWSYFTSYAILGDSRAVGFSTFEFLPQDHVMADGGNTIRNIEEHTEELQALAPEYIFLAYGLNDVSIGYWNTPEEYASEYAEILGRMSSALPDSKFYICSVIPATEEAINEREDKWADIPEYSDAVKKMAEKNGYGFVDISDLVAAHTDLYDPDGIHMQKAFYPYWGAAMIAATYDDYGAKDSTGSSSDSETQESTESVSTESSGE